MSTIGLIIGAVGSVAAAPNDEGVNPVPIWLEAEPAGNVVRLRVLGHARAELDASYTLEVRAGDAANRSLNSGTVKLRPDMHVTIASVTVGPTGASGWSARLRVQPASGEPYELIRSSTQ